MWIICSAADSHKMLSLIFWEKYTQKKSKMPAAVVIGTLKVNQAYQVQEDKGR